LFRLAQWAGNGLDNDPVLYGRRPNTVGAVHVNCYHYREYLAMAYIANRLNLTEESRQYQKRAQELADAINFFMWDDRDGMYYHLDLSDFDDVRDQEITWELPYKVKSWACLYPLWAGVCNPEQAERIVKEHILNPEEFLSNYGIRSLSADERIYNNDVMGDPSNWQGPVWGISTFLTAYGLSRYGYTREAEDIACRLIDVFACDLKTNGVLHEFYHADTGEPVMRPGFLSWNLLGARILDDIRNQYDPSIVPFCD
jgi:putative isomerase